MRAPRKAQVSRRRDAQLHAARQLDKHVREVMQERRRDAAGRGQRREAHTQDGRKASFRRRAVDGLRRCHE